MNTTKKTFVIPGKNLSYLHERLEKLNKKAAKLNVPQIETKVTQVETVLEGDKKRHFYHIEIDGLSITLPGGWEFLGTLEHVRDDAGAITANIVRIVPGVEFDSAPYRSIEAKCDHCQTNRRRRDTYLVKNTEGEVKQVGHQCVKDYLGHVNPHHIAMLAEITSDFQNATRWDYNPPTGLKSHGVCDLTHYLDFVAECIEQFGWVSKANASDLKPATSGRAFTELDNSLKGDEYAVEPSDKARLLARATIDWVNLQRDNTKNDYIYNLTVVFTKRVLEYRDLGLAASAVSTYMRESQIETERQIKAKAYAEKLQKDIQTSKHFGVVGERDTYTLTLNKKFAVCESSYGGTCYLYSFTDTAGNAAVWFSSNNVDLDEGRVYQVKATVKTHGEYKGVKQTTLTRCKVVVDAVSAKNATTDSLNLMVS